MLKDDAKLLLSEYVTNSTLETLKRHYCRCDEELSSISEEEILYLKILLILSKNLQRAKNFIDKYSELVKRPWTIKDLMVAIYGEDETTRIRRLLVAHLRKESNKGRAGKVVEKKHKEPNTNRKTIKRKPK